MIQPHALYRHASHSPCGLYTTHILHRNRSPGLGTPGTRISVGISNSFPDIDKCISNSFPDVDKCICLEDGPLEGCLFFVATPRTTLGEPTTASSKRSVVKV
jgi:hypothetical protein